MVDRELHLHSMIVHSVIAVAVVASVSCVVASSGGTVGPIVPRSWPLLCWGSLLLLAVAALPATLSGIAERNRMYANWHGSHRAKLWLSVLLVAMVIGELAAGIGSGTLRVTAPLGLAIVIGNPLVCLALSFYGLRITLGRQSLARTSYVPDLRREPPVDVLEEAARHVAEPARVLEILEEAAR